jgi:site-specific DNA-methyltransferase (adenine-specific)
MYCRNWSGALNIDGGRIGKEARMTHGTFNKSGNNVNKNVYSWALESGYIQTKKQGRWPSNLIIDKECAERFPMTADSKGGNGSKFNIKNRNALDKNSLSCNVNNGENGLGLGDSGSAARYFKNVEMKIDAADPVFYTSKVSKQERELGCSKIESSFENGIYGDGLGNLPKANGMRPTPVINRHPTLKSIDLTTYLATLLLPPLEYAPRRILVPFAGAGSEMIGCLKAGWEEIVGIELIEEYIPIIEARFEYYKKQIELEKSMQLFEPEIMESMKQEKLFE